MAAKRAAKEAIRPSTYDLNSALNKNQSIFYDVINKCAAQKLISSSEISSLTDTMCGRTLQARVGSFVDSIMRLVAVLPDKLDPFLTILHNTDDLVIQNVARDIANRYSFDLPTYRAAIVQVTVQPVQVSHQPVVPVVERRTVVRQGAMLRQGGEGVGRGGGGGGGGRIQVDDVPTPVVEFDISQLNDIMIALKDAYFSSGEWSRLGLGLGLYQPTLETIERDCKTAEECLKQCLAKWLRRHDGVDNKGGPTLIALVNALRSIDKAAAERIRQETFPQPTASETMPTEITPPPFESSTSQPLVITRETTPLSSVIMPTSQSIPPTETEATIESSLPTLSDEEEEEGDDSNTLQDPLVEDINQHGDIASNVRYRGGPLTSSNEQSIGNETQESRHNNTSSNKTPNNDLKCDGCLWWTVFILIICVILIGCFLLLLDSEFMLKVLSMY